MHPRIMYVDRRSGCCYNANIRV